MKCPKCFSKMDVYGVEVFDPKDIKLKRPVLEMPMLATCPRCFYAEDVYQPESEARP